MSSFPGIGVFPVFFLHYNTTDRKSKECRACGYDLRDRSRLQYFRTYMDENGVTDVEIQEAIRCRILELAAQRKWTVNKLAERSGIAPSVLKRTVKPYATVQRTSVETIARLCVGLEIPFKEFWDSPIFDEITTKQQEAESK